MRPAGIEAAFGAVEELERRSEALRREWENRIEQAEYEAGLARRRYEATDPDHRLVAANLERDWEERLREVDKLGKEFAERAAKPPISISREQGEKVRALAKDLPRLWRLKSTKQSDRKKVVRLVMRDVWLCQEDEPRQTRIRIHWQTGAMTEGTVSRPLPLHITTRTPEKVVARVRELYAECKSYEQIAEQLNLEGLKTGRNNPFNVQRVDTLIRNWRIKRTENKNKKA
jgi:hypothetical protein